MQIFTEVLILIFTGLLQIIPESPHFLISADKYDETAEFFNKCAKINKKQDFKVDGDTVEDMVDQATTEQ